MIDTPNRRVVVTGLGVISPIGCSPDDVWNSLKSQTSGVRRLESIPADNLPSTCGGEAREFTGDIAQYGPLEKKLKRTVKKGTKVMCREIQMGVAAAQLSLHHAGFEPGSCDPDRTGVVYGADYIMTVPEEFTDGIRRCLDEDGDFDFSEWAEKGLPRVDPLWLLKFLPNMPASHIAIYNDLRGPNNSLTLREASANLAVGEAYETIVRGSADVMIAGATGSRVHPLRTVHVMLQEELVPDDVPPEKACRPFDLNRQGSVIGEGAAALILEEADAAVARGATIYGEIVAWGSSTVADANGVGRGRQAIENVLRQSLTKANITAADVGHVHAHGLGTRKGDADEAAAIRAIFGNDKTPVTAAKSYFGNLGAGSGIVESIASMLAMQHDQMFPVLNYETTDPDCDITVAGVQSPVGDCFVNVNVTPQGQASSLLVKKFNG